MTSPRSRVCLPLASVTLRVRCPLHLDAAICPYLYYQWRQGAGASVVEQHLRAVCTDADACIALIRVFMPTAWSLVSGLPVGSQVERNTYDSLTGLVLMAQSSSYRGEAALAISAAIGWLRARGLIARTAGQTSEAAITVTKTGRLVAAEGPTAFRATERLQGGIHPRIEREARPQFLIGKYELAVFASMRAVEVRVRQLAALRDDLIGVDLMNQAFGPKGKLTDTAVAKGEQEGTRAFFAGAYAILRNPPGHREVNYDDVSEAADAVQTASLLMRILDRVEHRLNP
jgi:uncharacterized protein (TIGR02391 family)